MVDTVVWNRPGCVDSKRQNGSRACEATPMTGFRVTYATLSADDDDLHAAYDAALADAKSAFGERHPLHIGSERRAGAASFETVSPVDRDVVIGEFAAATPRDVADAVAAAEAAWPAWAARRGPNGWRSSTAPPT